MRRTQILLSVLLLGVLLLLTFLPATAAGPDLNQGAPTETPGISAANGPGGLSASQWASLVCGGLLVVVGVVLTLFNRRQKQRYAQKVAATRREQGK